MAPDFTDSDREPDETDGSNEMPGASQDGPSGPVDGALDVIDRSIGMYVLRRLAGRSSTATPKADAPVVLTADQIARRIGVAGAAPTTARGVDAAAGRCRVAATAGAARAAAAAIPPRSQGAPPRSDPNSIA